MGSLQLSVELFFIILSSLLLLGIGVFTWYKSRHQQMDSHIRSLFLKSASIPIHQEYLPEFQKEISRSRRYQRPLSVVVVTSENHSSQELEKILQNDSLENNNQEQKLTQIEFLFCGGMIRGEMREFDMISYDTVNNHYIIVLPESFETHTDQAVKRMKQMVDERFSKELYTGIAEFPQDGLTFDDLLEHARISVKSLDYRHSNIK